MAHLVLSGIPPEGLDLGSEESSWLRLNEREVSVACVELMAVAEVGTRHDCTGSMYCWINDWAWLSIFRLIWCVPLIMMPVCGNLFCYLCCILLVTKLWNEKTWAKLPKKTLEEAPGTVWNPYVCTNSTVLKKSSSFEKATFQFSEEAFRFSETICSAHG